MLDTVKLIIPKEQYKITKPDNFNPSINNFGSGIKHVQNPSIVDYKTGIYKPRLTIIRRKTRNGIEIPLMIEFSVPKLIFKNNLDELEEDDFENVISTLKTLLFEMGIKIEKKALEEAYVSVIHFSKNIVYENFNTVSMVLEAFSKVDISKKYDFTKTNFKNNGQALTVYSKTNSFVLYDKIQDIINPLTKSVDKDKTTFEKKLIERFKSKKIPLEILRIEARICNRKKIKEILSKVGFIEEINFKNIFRKTLSKKVLKFYIKIFYESESFLLNAIDSSTLEIFSILLKDKKSCKNILAIMGALTMVKKYGMGGLSKIINSKYSYKTWTRIKKDIEDLRGFNNGITVGYINQILAELNNFKSIKILELGV